MSKTYDRIYNKVPLFPNGTLIGNWFEEEELRKRTGEGRSIPGKNFPKKFMDFENPISNTNPRDDTFKRIIAQKHTGNYGTTYQTYGNFRNPEKKYMYKGKRETNFENFITKEILAREQIKNEKEPERLFDTTSRSTYVAQPFTQKCGARHMYTTDKKPIDQSTIDKLFLAQHKMGKFPRVLTDRDVDGYIDKNVPYYKDKEITFWSMNTDKGNMYRTATLGANPFGRSNAFTQDIRHTRGATQYEGNIRNCKSAKNIYFNDDDQHFYNTYNAFRTGVKVNENDIQTVNQKIINELRKKGWTGLRELRIYLRNIYQRKCNVIDKTEFKHNMKGFGIENLTNEDYDIIYGIFDRNKSNKIDFMEYFDSIHKVPEERRNLIEKLMDIANPKNDKFISAKRLELLADMNYHPEVLKYLKDNKQALRDYVTTWDNLREDDLITNLNFFKYFSDISACIETDEDFRQIMFALGVKE